MKPHTTPPERCKLSEGSSIRFVFNLPTNQRSHLLLTFPFFHNTCTSRFEHTVANQGQTQCNHLNSPQLANTAAGMKTLLIFLFHLHVFSWFASVVFCSASLFVEHLMKKYVVRSCSTFFFLYLYLVLTCICIVSMPAFTLAVPV